MIPGINASRSPRWHPARLAVPPQLALDARRVDLIDLSGSSIVGIRTVHGGVAANTPNLITYAASNAGLNGAPSINCPGTAAQALNFSTNLGSLLANKGGCTMIFAGKFGSAGAPAFNSAVVNATTTSNSSTRASIATSSSVGNCPRGTIRRLDGDSANGDDIGSTNFGANPWIGILRVDHAATVLVPGTPTKNFRINRGGAALISVSESTGLGTGNFSNTNSAYIGFFNSGTVAQAWADMFYGAIMDYVLTDAECEKYESWLAHGMRSASILAPTNPYLSAPPP